MLDITAQPLTREVFSEFGDVVDTLAGTSFAINAGRAMRHHDLARVETLGEGARAQLSIFVSKPVELPFELEFLERHPLGSQAFVPMDGSRFLVVVAPVGEAIDPGSVRAFVTNGRQGVNYRASVWHAPLAVLERSGELLVVDRGGEGANCDVHPLRLRVGLAAGC
ncbi:ureidoglycolate lyase [Candidimonas nitroreducens]|uniref:Ureidoglycolate lyase n=2 Tax=Candidimonas nitroreducens TaxID=683354 RepID=A0A225M3J5_9BURK|nr:ureidoglycolate lyase [Candidimonas nitroreducens]